MDQACNTNGLIGRRVLGAETGADLQQLDPLAPQQRSALVALACPDLPPSALSGRLHLQAQQRARSALGRHERACASGYRPHLRAAATARAVLERVAYPPKRSDAAAASSSDAGQAFDLAALFADVPRPGKDDSLFPLASLAALVAEEKAWGRLTEAVTQPPTGGDVLAAVAEGVTMPRFWCGTEVLQKAAGALDVRAVAARVAAARPASAAEAEARQRTSVFGRVVAGPEEECAAAAAKGAADGKPLGAAAAEADAASATAAAARADAAARERLLQRWSAEALPGRAVLLAAATGQLSLPQALLLGTEGTEGAFLWNGRSAAVMDALLTHWGLPPLGLHELPALGWLLQALAGVVAADRTLLQGGLCAPPFRPPPSAQQSPAAALQPLAFFATPDGLCRLARVLTTQLLPLAKTMGLGVCSAKGLQLAQLHVAALQQVLPSSADAAAAEAAAATPEAAAARRRELVVRTRGKYTARLERAVTPYITEMARLRMTTTGSAVLVKMAKAPELAAALAAAAFPPAAEAAFASAFGDAAAAAGAVANGVGSPGVSGGRSGRSAAPISGSFDGGTGYGFDEEEGDSDDDADDGLPAAVAVVHIPQDARIKEETQRRQCSNPLFQQIRMFSWCEAERLAVAAALAAALALPDVHGAAAVQAARQRATLVTVGAGAAHHALLQAALLLPIQAALADVSFTSHPLANRALAALGGVGPGDKRHPVAMAAACRGGAKELLGGCGVVVTLHRDGELVDAYEAAAEQQAAALSAGDGARQRQKQKGAGGSAGGSSGGGGQGRADGAGAGAGAGGDGQLLLLPLHLERCAVRMRFAALPADAQQRLEARRARARVERIDGLSPGQRLAQRQRIESHLRPGGRTLRLQCDKVEELMSAVAIVAEISSEWLSNDGRALAVLPLWEPPPRGGGLLGAMGSMLGAMAGGGLLPSATAAEDVTFLWTLRERLLLELVEGHVPDVSGMGMAMAMGMPGFANGAGSHKRHLRPDWQARQRLVLQRLLGSLSGVPTGGFIGWRAGDPDNLHARFWGAAMGHRGMHPMQAMASLGPEAYVYSHQGEEARALAGEPFFGGCGGGGGGAGLGLELMVVECEPGQPTAWL
ncbi:hypothetical protein HYH02_006739 [Chlamydomonas schloesseri]|uniref:Uncharacterized protein n=1 Tax=Chlamydomonas schloesseri TaxID=2026947 RepID=A0A835WIB7_9CHLO|nr:hypothetical protein HYH02_006739 [Chlamydomonas schloesseri]|eukprot:KAG2448154.1 hypothetical protein HYH02_006739 [Chlamydomonas schloesseri]